jgi:large subunit ribosomal protein L28
MESVSECVGHEVFFKISFTHVWSKKYNCASLHPHLEKLNVMAKVCQITGKRTRVGNNVSHANNKTKRKFFPNLQKKRFFLPSTGEWVTLKVAASALRTINKNGIESTIQKAYDKGTLTF